MKLETLNFSTVILAGGRSSRMGRDKAWIEYEGQPLIKNLIRMAEETGCTEVLISGRNDARYSTLGKKVLLDTNAGEGPLAGIERGLAEAAHPLVMVLAVDLPALTVSFLKGLISGCVDEVGVVPEVNGGLEPLVAIYPKRAHALAESRLNSGRLAARGFAQACLAAGLARAFPVSPKDAGQFVNWNSPDDLPPPTQ